jgi:acyl-CoA reductase-like NAD-dependent aldehyde dehydrogenase
MELVGDLLPPGVLNIVNGFGKEAGQALATSKRINKIAFTGSTPTGQHILHAAADNLIPSTVELGGKSPNIFFASVMDQDDAFFDKTLEGFSMFALNQGEICTCPSRILVQESIYERFIERAVKRVEAMKTGHPLEASTMLGAQVSQAQMNKILGYIDIGRDEGAMPDRRQPQRTRRRSRRGLLRQAHPALWQQQHADLSRGDLRPRRLGDNLQGRGRSHRDRERHVLRPGGGSLVARWLAGLSGRP